MIEVHGRIGAEVVPRDERPRKDHRLGIDPKEVCKVGHLFENIRTCGDHHSSGASPDEGAKALDEIHGHLYGIVTAGLAAPLHHLENSVSRKGRQGLEDPFCCRGPGFFGILFLGTPGGVTVVSSPHKNDFASLGCHANTSSNEQSECITKRKKEEILPLELGIF
jgi:hypothetical protein